METSEEMTTLKEQFEQAVKATRSGTNPPDAQRRPALDKLGALYERATTGPEEEREDAMRHYIQLVGELGQQDA